MVLHAPRIPQNTGQIARTCYAMGLRLHLIRPLGFRLDGATLARAGVGYWKEMNPAIHADGEAFWSAVDDPRRVHLITKRGNLPYTRARYRPGDWIVLGNETEGLPADWLEKYSAQTRVIPMANPEARCLNLASAASAVIFEALRQIGLPAGSPAAETSIGLETE